MKIWIKPEIKQLSVSLTENLKNRIYADGPSDFSWVTYYFLELKPKPILSFF